MPFVFNPPIHPLAARHQHHLPGGAPCLTPSSNPAVSPTTIGSCTPCCWMRKAGSCLRPGTAAGRYPAVRRSAALGDEAPWPLTVEQRERLFALCHALERHLDADQVAARRLHDERHGPRQDCLVSESGLTLCSGSPCPARRQGFAPLGQRLGTATPAQPGPPTPRPSAPCCTGKPPRSTPCTGKARPDPPCDLPPPPRQPTPADPPDPVIRPERSQGL